MLQPSESVHPLVSVVMPVFKPHDRFFPEAVQSILSQTLTNFELIVVEAPSARCGRAYLVGCNDARIRYVVFAEKPLLAPQLNRGVAKARADFVAILDCDDVSEPGRLETQLAFMQSSPEVAVVGSQVSIINEDGTVVSTRHYPLGHDSIAKALPKKMPMCQPSAMYRKTALQTLGGFQAGPYEVSEDYDMISRLALAGAQFANLPDVLIRYRFHREQMKATRLHNIIRATLHIKKLYWGDRLTLGDKIRMMAEWSLLALPAKFLYRLDMRVRYGI